MMGSRAKILQRGATSTIAAYQTKDRPFIINQSGKLNNRPLPSPSSSYFFCLLWTRACNKLPQEARRVLRTKPPSLAPPPPLLATPWHAARKCCPVHARLGPPSRFPEQYHPELAAMSGHEQSTYFPCLTCMSLLQRKVRLVHKCIPASLVQLPTYYRLVPHGSQYHLDHRCPPAVLLLPSLPLARASSGQWTR